MANSEFKGLSVRATNGLNGSGYYSRAQLEASVDNGTFQYEKMRNFGLKSYEEVLKWLGMELPKKPRKTCPHCGKEL